MSSFANLPIELLIPILTFASYSSRQAAYNVCLVASWTLSFTRPSLYQTVLIRSPTAVHDVLVTIERYSYKRGELPEHNGSDYLPQEQEPLEDSQRLCLQVKNLWNDHAEPKDLARYLSLCPNVANLAISTANTERFMSFLKPTSYEGDEVLEREESRLRIAKNVKKLAVLGIIGPSDWEDIMATERNPAKHFMLNLTHLVLHRARETIDLPLHDLPNVTHVAIPFSLTKYQYNTQTAIARGETYHPFATAVNILPDATGELQMLVLHVPHHEMASRWGLKWQSSPFLKKLVLNANTADKRLYITPMSRNNKEIVQKWEDEVRGVGSLWDEAVDLLLRMALQNMNIKE